MWTLICRVLLGLLTLTFTALAPAQEVGPARFFDLPAIRDESTLATTIRSDAVRASGVRPGQRVRVIELEFTSQHWKGLVWKHPARIYVPDGYAGGGNAGIIGTERQFFDRPDAPRRRIPGTELDTEAEYGEATALDLGLPIMLFANPAEDYWGLGESDLAGYTLRQALKTGDLSWNGYHPITVAYLRAITLLHALPGVASQRAVLMGCSKRGQAVGIATGVDPERVAGVMATCHFGGNTLYYIARKFAEFGAGVGGPDQVRQGPGFQPADEVLRAINNPIGLQMLVHYDPYMWRNHIRAPFLVALGTNDEFFALGTPNSMLSEMKGDRAFLAMDNLRHSWVSTKHLAAWRMWLAHSFLGRPIPGISARAHVDGAELAVQARVEAAPSPIKVRLFHAYNPLQTDWRRAHWSAIELPLVDGAYAARLPRREGQRLAWYVEVEDRGAGGAGYVSSLVQIAD